MFNWFEEGEDEDGKGEEERESLRVPQGGERTQGLYPQGQVLWGSLLQGAQARSEVADSGRSKKQEENKMARQKLNLKGPSSLSLLDGVLGGAAGFGVPYVVDKLLMSESMATTRATNAWITDYHSQLGALAGIGVSIPLYFLRGFAPAIIGVSTAVMYAGFTMLESTLMGETPVVAPATPAALGRIRARQLGAIRAQQLPRGQASALGQLRARAVPQQLPVSGGSSALGAVARELPVTGSGSALGALRARMVG